MPHLIAMTPCELRDAVEKKAVLILPLGSVEFHGNHLPLGTDTYLAQGVAEWFADEPGVVVAPTIVYAPTGYAVSGPEKGTMDVRPESFYRYLFDVLQSIVEMGFRSIVVLCHHQSLEGVSAKAAEMAVAELFCGLTGQEGRGWWTAQYHTASSRFPDIRVVNTTLGEETRIWPGHGGAGETQGMLAMRPELVRMEYLAEQDFPWNWSGEKTAADASAEAAREDVQYLKEKWRVYLSEMRSVQNLEQK